MFDLEKLERKLIAILLIALLAGAGVAVYRNSSPSGYLRIDSSGVSPEREGREISDKDSKVNINTASRSELLGLDGIGPALALRITRYRKDNGPFISVEDLKKVSGIGDKLFSRIKDRVSLE